MLVERLECGVRVQGGGQERRDEEHADGQYAAYVRVRGGLDGVGSVADTAAGDAGGDDAVRAVVREQEGARARWEAVRVDAFAICSVWRAWGRGRVGCGCLWT